MAQLVSEGAQSAHHDRSYWRPLQSAHPDVCEFVRPVWTPHGIVTLFWSDNGVAMMECIANSHVYSVVYKGITKLRAVSEAKRFARRLHKRGVLP